MKKLLLVSLALMGCVSKEPKPVRANRAVQAVLMANPKATCTPNSLGIDLTTIPDTAYCEVYGHVIFVEASPYTMPKFTQYGERKAELPAADGGAK